MARILAVDDDPSIRSMIEQILAFLGHEALVVSSGLEALAALKKYPAELIITDIVMPDMTGVKLIAEIRQQTPDMKIISISGGGPHYSAETCLETARAQGADSALTKPFSSEELSTRIDELLRKGPRSPQHRI